MFLCAVKLKESTPRINVRGRSEFPIEEELRKLAIAVPIDDKNRICKLSLKKLRKQKSLRDSLQESTEVIVQTFRQPARVRVDPCQAVSFPFTRALR